MRHHLKSNYFLAFLLVCGATCGFLIVSRAYATTTVQANICNAVATPVITEPATGIETEAASIVVKGTGEPAMSVVILENGVNVGSTTVMPDGSYALEAPLTVGNNVLVARESDSCGNKDSAAVTVRRLATPSPTPSQPAQSPQNNAASGNNVPGASPGLGGTPNGSTTSPSGESSSGTKPFFTNLRQNQQFSANRVWVAGKAAPGSMVTIYVNGKQVARVMAAEDGTFGAMIPLEAGKNTLQAEAKLNGGSLWSDKLDIYYIKHATSLFKNDYTWEWWVMILSILLLLVLIIWLLYRHHKRKEKTWRR